MILNSLLEDPLQETEVFQNLLCYYVNSTPYLQVLKLLNSPFKLERVLFPEQRLLFTAMPEAQLEIKTCKNGFLSGAERIPCDRLQVQESESLSPVNP